MITQIKGKLIEKNPTQVVVDCNGIGYEINISLHTFSSISADENIQLYTHLQVREDAHILYGFFTVQERSVFRLLISVKCASPRGSVLAAGDGSPRSSACSVASQW